MYIASIAANATTETDLILGYALKCNSSFAKNYVDCEDIHDDIKHKSIV